jgi:hypothetical protein
MLRPDSSAFLYPQDSTYHAIGDPQYMASQAWFDGFDVEEDGEGRGVV